jgi:hypothetical protein
VTPTEADDLSVEPTGTKAAEGAFGAPAPKVVDVRVNGHGFSAIRDQEGRRPCALLFAVDGRPAYLRLPRPEAVLSGRLLHLRGCQPIRLGPGRHRIESLSRLSGAVLGTSLVPLGQEPPRGQSSAPNGDVAVVDRSPTRLDL